MGDKERSNIRMDPTEDLERYIDEVKRKGESLRDETLERLIFSPEGSNSMEAVKIIQRKEEKESGYEEDFADAFELIQEDVERAGRSNVNTVAEEVEVYEDAQSYFDPTSVSSPYAVVSPSMRGSLLPLSPDTNFAMHKMSRVSLCSPAAATPAYFPPNAQGVAPSSHSTSVQTPPTSIVHQHSIRPSHQPPNLPPSHQSPVPPQSYPNGNYHLSGMAGPSYSSHMAPSPYIPSSVPLPPSNGSTPSMNMMSSSISNPLFSPYSQPLSNHPYPIHTSQYIDPPHSNQSYPHHSSPYPSLPLPPSAPMIHHQRTVQTQRTPEEMALFLAQHDQITSRMISQVPPQMSRPLHTPSVHHPHPSHLPHHPQQSNPSHPSHPSQSSSFNRPSRYSSYMQSVSSTHPSSTIPSFPPYLSSVSTDLVYQNHQRQHEKEEAKEKEKKLMPIERPKLTNDDIIRLVRWRHKSMLAKEQKGERKFTAIADLDQDDISEFNRYLMIMQSKRPEKEGGKYKQDEHGLITVNGLKMKPRKTTFVSAFTLPVGKQISDYVKKKEEDDRPPIIILPSTLKYIPKVPLCAEGKVKPQLCRGHENTKERKENPDLFGGKYMEKIQGLFHSVTGDPRRVPNKSTTGEKWEYPFKDGEVPPGMEVHYNVEGRMWNPEYDYHLVFEQLHEISERVMGFRFELPPEKRERRSASQTRLFEKDLFERDLTKAEEVPEFGNVIEVNARSGRIDYDDDLSDCDDGRIAEGREELIRYEEKIKEKKRKEEEELEKALDSDWEDDDEEVGQEKEETKIVKEKKKMLVRDLSKKIHPGYYPVMKDGKEWGRISYYERIEEVGKPFKCCKRFPKVFVDPHVEEKDETKLERFPLAAIDRLDRDFKTNKILRQPDMTFYFKNKAGGYIILGSDSTPPIFVQSPLYNAMMGEELDTIVRITKGHEMIIYDENFFNYLLHQAYQYGHKTLYEMKQMLLTRVSTTKGWGEAYQKSTILDALVWIEFSVSNGMKKLDTLLTSNYSKLQR